MADLVANVAAGKIAEYAARVAANDPANSALVIALLATTGLESDAVLRDTNDFAALLAGATNEATNTGYARIVLTDASGITVTVDDTNNWVDVDIPDQSWVSIANDGTGAVSKLVVGYDSDTTAGTDSGIVLVSLHDFAFTPDGTQINVVIPSGGFLRATT